MILALTNTNRWYFLAYGLVKVKRIWGSNNTGVGLYIQFHQKIPNSIATPLALNDVPVGKSLYATANDGFTYDFSPEGVIFDPLTIGVSSTEPAYTDAGASAGLDMTVEYDTLYATNGNETITGDLTTGVDAINPWTDVSTNAGKDLLRIDYTNNDNAARYLLLSADAGVSAIPMFTNQVATTVAITLFPGRTFTSIYSQDSTFTGHYGCRLLQSTSASVAGLTSSVASYIKALWR